MKDVMGALGLGVRFRRCRFLSIMNHKKKEVYMTFLQVS